MDTTSTAKSVISSDRIEGTSVYDTSGEKLGSIDTLMIDKLSGQVRYAVLEFGGFLGMGTDRYPLPWSTLKYDTTLDGYVVPVDRRTLEAAPSYSSENRPDFNEDFGRKVYGHYGATWY